MALFQVTQLCSGDDLDQEPGLPFFAHAVPSLRWNILALSMLAASTGARFNSDEGQPIGDVAAEPWAGAANHARLAAFGGQGAQQT